MLETKQNVISIYTAQATYHNTLDQLKHEEVVFILARVE